MTFVLFRGFLLLLFFGMLFLINPQIDGDYNIFIVSQHTSPNLHNQFFNEV